MQFRFLLIGTVFTRLWLGGLGSWVFLWRWPCAPCLLRWIPRCLVRLSLLILSIFLGRLVGLLCSICLAACPFYPPGLLLLGRLWLPPCFSIHPKCVLVEFLSFAQEQWLSGLSVCDPQAPSRCTTPPRCLTLVPRVLRPQSLIICWVLSKSGPGFCRSLVCHGLRILSNLGWIPWGCGEVRSFGLLQRGFILTPSRSGLRVLTLHMVLGVSTLGRDRRFRFFQQRRCAWVVGCTMSLTEL